MPNATVNPWVPYKKGLHFDNFLSENIPSKSVNPQKFWIWVPGPDITLTQAQTPVTEDTICHCQKLWKTLITNHTDGSLLEELKEITKACKHTQGKWIIHRKPALVDAVWEKVARAVMMGTLGTHAKVSTRSSANQCKGNEHAIHIYTQDFTDEEDVINAQRKIREIGIMGKLVYKPDIFQDLGIFHGNSWGIPCNLYESKTKPRIIKLSDEE